MARDGAATCRPRRAAAAPPPTTMQAAAGACGLLHLVPPINRQVCGSLAARLGSMRTAALQRAGAPLAQPLPLAHGYGRRPAAGRRSSWQPVRAAASAEEEPSEQLPGAKLVKSMLALGAAGLVSAVGVQTVGASAAAAAGALSRGAPGPCPDALHPLTSGCRPGAGGPARGAHGSRGAVGGREQRGRGGRHGGRLGGRLCCRHSGHHQAGREGAAGGFAGR